MSSLFWKEGGTEAARDIAVFDSCQNLKSVVFISLLGRSIFIKFTLSPPWTTHVENYNENCEKAGGKRGHVTPREASQDHVGNEEAAEDLTSYFFFSFSF